MRNRIALAVLCVVLTVAAFALPSIRQTQAQGNMLTCDSTLVVLLYVAEHDHGYKPSMDVAALEKGQYKPLFEAMMAGSMMEATPAGMMDKSGDMMATPDAMMMTLKPGIVQGENEFCTKLRAEIEDFLYKKLSGDMKSMTK